MDVKAAYVLGTFAYWIALFVAAAHFNNWWSVAFVLIGLCHSVSFGERMKRWESRGEA